MNFRRQPRSPGMWIFITLALAVKLAIIFAIFG
jgi:hypothetical protein